MREREREKDGLILALSPGKNRTGSRTEEIRPRDYLSICFLRACAAGRRRRREKVYRRGNRNQERRGKGEGSERLGKEIIEGESRIGGNRKGDEGRR